MCGFCESIEFSVRLNRPDDRLWKGYWARYTVETYRDLDRTGEWDFAGQSTSGKYPLIYCPECGKRLRWAEPPEEVQE